MQKQAILVMLQSIKQQVAAVEAMIGLSDDEVSGPARTTRIPQTVEGVLSDREDEELGDMLAIPPEMLAKRDLLLHEILTQAAAPPPEPPKEASA